MMYIGNILTDKKSKYNELMNITDEKSGLIEGIPTLVVGWEFTKTNYPEANIIDREIGDGLYWTFGKRERRDRYESDVEWFTNECFNIAVKNVKYKYINVVKDGMSLLNEFVNDSFSYIYGGMVYIYQPREDCVFGVSIRDVGYIGIDEKKFIAKIYRRTNVVQVGDDISYETKKMLYGSAFAVPYLMKL